jgi:Fatty acid desaturase
VHLLLGVALSMAFQLAHTVEHTSFPTPDAHTSMMPAGWAEHEVKTTANFAPHNPWVTWYLGGLNLQIEHHLFARICHIHSPAISTMVAETCHAFALPMLPDGSGGHCGALSLLEDDGEKAQRPVIPILPRNDTYSRDHHRYTGTIVGHAVKESPCTCHPPNKKLPLATSSWPSWGWC